MAKGGGKCKKVQEKEQESRVVSGRGWGGGEGGLIQRRSCSRQAEEGGAAAAMESAVN